MIGRVDACRAQLLQVAFDLQRFLDALPGCQRILATLARLDHRLTAGRLQLLVGG
jgi:hypothetical protein